jgi:hypothetical protein
MTIKTRGRSGKQSRNDNFQSFSAPPPDLFEDAPRNRNFQFFADAPPSLRRDAPNLNSSDFRGIAPSERFYADLPEQPNPRRQDMFMAQSPLRPDGEIMPSGAQQWVRADEAMDRQRAIQGFLSGSWTPPQLDVLNRALQDEVTRANRIEAVPPGYYNPLLGRARRNR